MDTPKRGQSAPRAKNTVVWKRLLAAVEALLTGPLGRADIAREVGEPDRDPDAVTRDIKTLRDAGFDIADARGRSYELGIASVPLWITPDEAASLIAAQGLAERAAMPEAHTLAALIARVPQKVRAACGPQAIAAFGDIVVDYKASESHIRVLRSAIARRRMVKLYYQAPGLEAEWRTVDAARLVWVEGTLVFQGITFPLRSAQPWQDVRDFRVDRIRTIDVLEQVWQATTVPTFKFTFRLPAKRAYLKSDFPRDAVMDDEGGDFCVTLEEASLLRARRFVLRYGAEAEVLSPPELIEEMKAITRDLAKIYQGAE